MQWDWNGPGQKEDFKGPFTPSASTSVDGRKHAPNRTVIDFERVWWVWKYAKIKISSTSLSLSSDAIFISNDVIWWLFMQSGRRGQIKRVDVRLRPSTRIARRTPCASTSVDGRRRAWCEWALRHDTLHRCQAAVRFNCCHMVLVCLTTVACTVATADVNVIHHWSILWWRPLVQAQRCVDNCWCQCWRQVFCTAVTVQMYSEQSSHVTPCTSYASTWRCIDLWFTVAAQAACSIIHRLCFTDSQDVCWTYFELLFYTDFTIILFFNSPSRYSIFIVAK